MIFDQERMFLDNVKLNAGEIVSEVLKMGAGDASIPLTLVLRVSKDAGTGTAKTILETSKDASFTVPKVLATYEAVPLTAVLPYGNLGFLRIRVESAYANGAVTAGLVCDGDTVP